MLARSVHKEIQDMDGQKPTVAVGRNDVVARSKAAKRKARLGTRKSPSKGATRDPCGHLAVVKLGSTGHLGPLPGHLQRAGASSGRWRWQDQALSGSPRFQRS